MWDNQMDMPDLRSTLVEECGFARRLQDIKPREKRVDEKARYTRWPQDSRARNGASATR